MKRQKVLVAMAVAVVAAAAVAVVVVRDRPPVSGDHARTFEPSAVGLPDDVSNVLSPAAGGGMTVLAGDRDETGVVVDHDGGVVSRDVAATPVMVRRDGSGVSTRTSDDAVRVTGFDPKGRRTFEIDGEGGLRSAADDAGASLPDGDVRAVVDTVTTDEIVIEACVTGDDRSTSVLLGIDGRTGEARWHRVDRTASCTLRDEPTRASELVHRRVVGDEQVVVDAATGEVVWRTDDTELRVAVVDDVIYTQAKDGSLARLDDTGSSKWTIDGCRDDLLYDQPLDRIALRSSGPFMVLSCGSRLVAIDPRTGRSRDLPRDAHAYDERYVEGSFSSDVAPTYLHDLPEEELDRAVTPVIGTVLVERSGRVVTATDALSGKRLWAHDADADDDDRVTVQAFVPTRGEGSGSVVVRSVSYDRVGDSGAWAGSADVTVLDARTGREVAHTRDRGRWTVSDTPAGDVLLVRDGDDPVMTLVDRSS